MTTFLAADLPPLLGWRELQPIVGFSRATLHREMNACRFPRPIMIAAQRTAWPRQDIENWIAARVAARDRAT